MYLPEDIILNILEYSSDSNLKVSDNALLERIQVIDPSFCLSHAIQDFNRQKKDKDDPMYPLFSLLSKYKRLHISNIQESSLSVKWDSNDREELCILMRDRYPNVSTIFIGERTLLSGIDTNALYRLFVIYKNRYDPLTYKFDYLRSHTKDNYPIYSSDEIPIYVDASFSLRDQLRLAIEKSNRDRQIKKKIESLRLSHAYPLWIQMRDKPYHMYIQEDTMVVISIDIDALLVFPKEMDMRIRTILGDGCRLYILLGTISSIISDLALLIVLHDNHNYNFDKTSIRIN